MAQQPPVASAVDAFKSNNFNVKKFLNLQENSADGYKTAYRIIDAATAAATHMDILPDGLPWRPRTFPQRFEFERADIAR